MDDGYMESKSGSQGGCAFSETEVPDKQQQTWVAFLPGKAAASLRADVAFTRPQGNSTHAQQDVQGWEYNRGHSTAKKEEATKKITAWGKMPISMYYLYVNTKEMATCQLTGSPKTVTKNKFCSREESFHVNLTGRPAPPEISLCWFHCGGILFKTHSPWPIYIHASTNSCLTLLLWWE